MTLPWLVAFGASVAIVFTKGTVFKPFRTHGPTMWRELVSCSMCSGTWIGFFFALSRGYGVDGSVLLRVSEVLGIGCLTGAVAWIARSGAEALVTYSDNAAADDAVLVKAIESDPKFAAEIAVVELKIRQMERMAATAARLEAVAQAAAAREKEAEK